MEPNSISFDFAEPITDSPIIFDRDDQDSNNIISSDIHPSNFCSSPSNTNVPGRTKNNFTIILEQFTTESLPKKPKKEFLNVYIIRQLKELLDQYKKGKYQQRRVLLLI